MKADDPVCATTYAAARLDATLPRFTPTRPPALAQPARILSDGPVVDHEFRIVPWFWPASAPTDELPRTLALGTPSPSTSAVAASNPNSPWLSEPERSMYRFATARPLPSKVAANGSVEPPSGVQPPELFAPALQSAFTVPDA